MIRNVVFDIGGVLVRLRYQRFIEYLGEAGIDMTRPARVARPSGPRSARAWRDARCKIAGADRGDGTAAARSCRAAPSAGSTCSSAATRCSTSRRASWAATASTCSRISATCTGTHLDTRYGVGSLVHGACASYQVGAIKPTTAIYRKAESMFGLDPAATVFIDDLPPNVAAARDCGWHAIHHRDARDTCAAAARPRCALAPAVQPRGVAVSSTARDAALSCCAGRIQRVHDVRLVCAPEEPAAAARGTSPRSRAGALRCSSTCCRCRPTASATRR